MVDFVFGRAVIDAAYCKRVKYEAKCPNIGYGFLPFLFSSLRELEKDAVNLLKRIRKFYVTQDIGARADVHIFNKISFAIAKGLENAVVEEMLALREKWEDELDKLETKFPLADVENYLQTHKPVRSTYQVDIYALISTTDTVKQKRGFYMARMPQQAAENGLTFPSADEGKENGVNILKSVNEGPFQMGTFRETLAEGDEGGPRVYSDLSPEEKERYNVDIQMGTFRETLTEGDEGAFHLGPERPRVYSDLSPEEKERYNVDIQKVLYGRKCRGRRLSLVRCFMLVVEGPKHGEDNQ
nr:protein chromatin remodeling 20 isoform X4 [Tanacetum cinerariifolium]